MLGTGIDGEPHGTSSVGFRGRALKVVILRRGALMGIVGWGLLREWKETRRG